MSSFVVENLKLYESDKLKFSIIHFTYIFFLYFLKKIFYLCISLFLSIWYRLAEKFDYNNIGFMSLFTSLIIALLIKTSHPDMT